MGNLLYKRVIGIVLDGCGAGPAPDAEFFGDFGENEGNTLFNTWNSVGKIDAPHLGSIGFFEAAGIDSLGFDKRNATYGRLREISLGKDTVTGHWEMMGIHLAKPFPTYPDGFPIPLIKAFEKAIGMQTIGNEAASGTEIINRLGKMHIESGCPIVYTSADSVFQIACHEEIIDIHEQYRICKIARELLVEPNNVGRVIARPFLGDSEHGFKRTERRKDFPLPAPHNLIDSYYEKHGEVFGIGVIPEVFAGRGFKSVKRTQDNREHFEMLMSAMDSEAKFIWANFEDTDMLFGHRNDAPGFATCLKEFDLMLGKLIEKMNDDDLLFVTADHGNDPTTPSTDHSREYVPISLYSKNMHSRKHFGDRDGLWCVGATVARLFDIEFAKGEVLI